MVLDQCGSQAAISVDECVHDGEMFIVTGIDPARVKAVWFGDRDPVGDNATEEGRAQNRRVEFRFFNAAINASNAYGQDVSFTG